MFTCTSTNHSGACSSPSKPIKWPLPVDSTQTAAASNSFVAARIVPRFNIMPLLYAAPVGQREQIRRKETGPVACGKGGTMSPEPKVTGFVRTVTCQSTHLLTVHHTEPPKMSLLLSGTGTQLKASTTVSRHHSPREGGVGFLQGQRVAGQRCKPFRPQTVEHSKEVQRRLHRRLHRYANLP